MLDWMLGKTRERGGGGGGGGRPRIRFGNTGPRGRMYGKPPKGTVAIAKSKYIRAGKGSHAAIREHLRYIQERERAEHEPERKFFDRDRQGIERGEVFEKMLENRGDRTAMHTLILSPGDNRIDIQDYTRESMEALEERMGHRIDWYATIHENTDHYHAHVVIAGKIPGWEREVERREAKGWQRDYNAAIDRAFDWKNQEAELRALLGERYDEREPLDPREERRAEREFGRGSEQEPTDPRVKELLGDRTISPEELRTEKFLDRYERQMAIRESAKDRGEVYLDVNDLRELRSAGNDYVHRERSLERSLDRAYEREFGYSLDRERDRDRDREMSRDDDRGGWSDINRMWEADRELSREQGRSYERGAGDDRSRDDDEERKRGRDRDDFDRGR